MLSKRHTAYIIILGYLTDLMIAHKTDGDEKTYTLFQQDQIRKVILDQGHSENCLKYATSSLLQYNHQLEGVTFPSYFSAEKIVKQCDICGQQGDLVTERIFEFLKDFINPKTGKLYFKTMNWKTARIHEGEYNNVSQLKSDLKHSKMAIAEIRIRETFTRLSENKNNFCDKNPDGSISHIVLLTGYDDSFFELQNSWGIGWGNKGLANICISNALVNKVIFVDIEINK